jgi:hypothetical protein
MLSVVALFGCQTVDATPDNAIACEQTIEDFCAHELGGCPDVSAEGTCAWLARRGTPTILWGGSVECDALGLSGFGVTFDGADRYILYDESRTITAIVEPESGPNHEWRCVAGPRHLHGLRCEDWLVGFQCLLPHRAPHEWADGFGGRRGI